MRESANIISKILTELSKEAKVGVNLLDLDKQGSELIKKYGATSINKGYAPAFAKGKKFPSYFCLSVNDEITHAPARDYVLQNGDLLKIDAGIKFEGYAADAALTVGVGNLIEADLELMKHTKNALYIGIDEICAGKKISTVGAAIDNYARTFGYAITKPLLGHLIGEEMHDGYNIPMYRAKVNEGAEVPVFEEGDVVCIEPHLTHYDWHGILDKNGWTVRTRDEENSVMFEHEVLVLKDGYEILTDHISL